MTRPYVTQHIRAWHGLMSAFGCTTWRIHTWHEVKMDESHMDRYVTCAHTHSNQTYSYMSDCYSSWLVWLSHVSSWLIWLTYVHMCPYAMRHIAICNQTYVWLLYVWLHMDRYFMHEYVKDSCTSTNILRTRAHQTYLIAYLSICNQTCSNQTWSIHTHSNKSWSIVMIYLG